jgi:hypothetical protein
MARSAVFLTVARRHRSYDEERTHLEKAVRGFPDTWRIVQVDPDQCDQIGRIFASWVLVYFGMIKVVQIVGLLFSSVTAVH